MSQNLVTLAITDEQLAAMLSGLREVEAALLGVSCVFLRTSARPQAKIWAPTQKKRMERLCPPNQSPS